MPLTKLRPVISNDMLYKYNFFELYPFDGGGSFIHYKFIRSIDDINAAENILAGAMDDFGTLPKIDFNRFERWSSIEQSCWINRMYFLAPLAKYASVKNDEKVAETICQILEHFTENYPAPGSLEEAAAHHRRVMDDRDNGYNAHGPEYDGPTEYIWFDFQVASRIIHIIHALYFLRTSSVLTPERQEIFLELLRVHARTIFYVEKYCDKPAPGNHQALRALALLYACELFKEEEETAQWLPLAMNLCQYHILNDFLIDGMLNDLSPSYHFFETWIMRDMIAIAKRNNWDFSPEVDARAQEAFKVCRLMQQPDGLSPIINDGYALNMTGFLNSIPYVEVPEKTVLKNSGFAIWRTNKEYLLFDCSPLLTSLSHYHAGKLAPTLFIDGKQFLVDGGTCNYDDPEFSLYYKRSCAHSSLTIDDNDDATLQGRYTWLVAPQIEISNWEDNTIRAKAKSQAPGWEDITWERSITANNNQVVIDDNVISQREINMTFQLMLHSDVKVERQGQDLLLITQDTVLKMTSPLPFTICGGQGFLNFRQTPQLKIVFNTKAWGGKFQIKLTKISK